MLVIFRGLPGTGKSHLVRRLVESRPDILVLSRDALRLSMIPHPSYTSVEKALVDDLVCAAAGFLLGRHRHVVIDGMALSSAARVDELVRIAASRSVPAKIIECVCGQETALARISADGGSHPAGDRSRALYFEVKARFQPVPYPVLTVDTDREDDVNLSAILAHLAD